MGLVQVGEEEVVSSRAKSFGPPKLRWFPGLGETGSGLETFS